MYDPKRIEELVNELTDTKHIRMGFSLPENLYKKFRQKCKENGLKQSYVIVFFIKIFLEGNYNG